MPTLVWILLAIANICGRGDGQWELLDPGLLYEGEKEVAVVGKDDPFLATSIEDIQTHLNDLSGFTKPRFVFNFYKVHEAIKNLKDPNKIDLANVIFKETVCKTNEEYDISKCDFIPDGKAQNCHVNLIYAKRFNSLQKIIFVCHPFNVIYDIIKLISRKDDNEFIFKLYRIYARSRNKNEETMLIGLKETDCPKGAEFPSSFYQNCTFKKDAKRKHCHVRVLHDPMNYPKEVYFICNSKHGAEIDDVASQAKDISLIVNGTYHGVIVYTAKDHFVGNYSELDLALYVLKRDYFQPSRQEYFRFHNVKDILSIKDGVKVYELLYREGVCKKLHPKPSKTSGCVFTPNGREKMCNVTLTSLPAIKKSKVKAEYVCTDIASVNVAETLQKQTELLLVDGINSKFNVEEAFRIVEIHLVEESDGILMYQVTLQESRCPQPIGQEVIVQVEIDQAVTLPVATASDSQCELIPDGVTVNCNAILDLSSYGCPQTLKYDCKRNINKAFLDNQNLQATVKAELSKLFKNYTNNQKFYEETSTSATEFGEGKESQNVVFSEVACDGSSTIMGCTVIKTVDPVQCEVVLHLGPTKRPASVTLSCPHLAKGELDKRMSDHIIYEILRDINNKQSTTFFYQFVSQKFNQVNKYQSKSTVMLQQTDCKKEPRPIEENPPQEYTQNDLESCSIRPDGKQQQCEVLLYTTKSPHGDAVKKFKFSCSEVQQNGKDPSDHYVESPLIDAVIIFFPQEVLRVPDAVVDINVENFPFEEDITDQIPWTHKCERGVTIIPGSRRSSTCELVRPLGSKTISDSFLFTCRAERVYVPCEAIVAVNKKLHLEYFLKVKTILEYQLVLVGRQYEVTVIQTSCKRVDHPYHEIAYCPEVPDGVIYRCTLLVYNESSSFHPKVEVTCSPEHPPDIIGSSELPTAPSTDLTSELHTEPSTDLTSGPPPDVKNTADPKLGGDTVVSLDFTVTGTVGSH